MPNPPQPAVLLTREPPDNRPLRQALAARGVAVVELPCVATAYLQPPAPAPGAAAVTFSSRRGVRGLVRAGLAASVLDAAPRPLLGAVGAATAAELAAAGWQAELVADPPEGEVLAGMLVERLRPGARVLAVRGKLRAGGLDAVLRRAGLEVDSLEVYANEEPRVEQRPAFPLAAVFIASPSAARRLLAANPWMRSARFFCIGRSTERALAELGAARVERIGADRQRWVEALCTAAADATGGS